MDFVIAHCFRDRLGPSAAKAGRRLATHAGGLVFCLAAHAACGTPSGPASVAAVNERLEVVLADGTLVRLGGLDLPEPGRGDRTMAAGAHDFLSARLVGREVELSLLADRPDRWGREVADLSVAETPGGPPVSVAAALLRAGYARVRPDFEARGCAAARLAIEDAARRSALGLWRDLEYAVVPSSDLAALRRRDGQFVVIEGRVRRVGFGRSRLYVDLAPRDGPTIVVARKLEFAFVRAGHPIGGLTGQTIRARGALDLRFGPRLEVSDPVMIEVLRRSDGPGVD